jgi:DNA polymerase-4
MRTILHIDMNAFFASVEQRADPALRGRPIAVVGSQKRGVVLSPSYEARAYGVRTGMQYHEARGLCPGITLVPADPGKYASACKRLIRVWEQFTPVVELFSIDEAFLDVTGCDALFGDPVRLALRIKEQVWEQEQLTCSIGIAPNKLLAKLGSDMVKPDGLVLITPDDVPEVMRDLPVKELCGIGPSTTRELASMGIRTCGELGRAPLDALTARFGSLGPRLRDMGRGIDPSAVATAVEQQETEARSVGHSMTLNEDCADRERIERHILQLAEKVGRRMRRGGYRGRTVSLTLRYSDFTTFSRQRRVARALCHGPDVFTTAIGIFREIVLDRAIRLVGVSVSSLEQRDEQVPLFDLERKRTFTSKAMDRINDRYGDFTITWGSLAKRFDHGRVISPAWRPGGTREY